MADAPNPDRFPKAQMNKSAWRLVALGLILVSLALISGLLAQAGLFESDSSDNPDPLTTLALVLAILAFLVQIFVFVFQTIATQDAIQRSEELNSETRSVLEKIEANSAATQRVLFAQFDRLLDYVVAPASASSDQTDRGDAEEDAAEEGTGSDSEAVTTSNLDRAVAEAIVRTQARPSFSGAGAVQGASAEDQRILAFLKSYPDRDEAEQAVAEVLKLSPAAVAALARMATLEVSQRRAGQRVGVTRRRNMPPQPHTQELIDAGLVHGPEGDDRYMPLTEKGRAATRILPTGLRDLGKQPDWFPDVTAPLRQRPRTG